MRRMIIVIVAEQQALGNQLALEWDPEGGQNTFTVPLSPTGQEPFTHYWASVTMPDATFDAIATELDPYVAQSQAWYFEQPPENPESVLSQLGLQRIEEVI